MARESSAAPGPGAGIGQWSVGMSGERVFASGFWDDTVKAYAYDTCKLQSSGGGGHQVSRQPESLL